MIICPLSDEIKVLIRVTARVLRKDFFDPKIGKHIYMSYNIVVIISCPLIVLNCLKIVSNCLKIVLNCFTINNSYRQMTLYSNLLSVL